MKTNRRGFFRAIAGLAAGVYAAFVPKDKIALGAVDAVTLTCKTGGDSTEPVIDWVCFETYFCPGDKITLSGDSLMITGTM